MPIRKPPDLAKLDMSSGSITGNARESTFTLSDSGTFSKDDFRLKAGGIESSPFGVHKGSQLLDQLQPVRPLGSGASSVVKLVRHPPSGQQLALKQLAAMEDPGLREQVINELKVLCDVRCDFLVSLYDAFYREGMIYLALEFMDRGSLEDVVARARASVAAAHGGVFPLGHAAAVPERVLGQVVVQVLQGLIYLHKEKHQLHRDLKPANILLNSGGEVKLSDFGISRQLANTMEVASSFVGTAHYMSPERILGHTYGFPADIWCVGLIALECALGEYPYKATTNYFDLVRSIVDGPVAMSAPAVHALLHSGHVSAEFADFVGHCLSKDPSARPTALQLMNHPFVQRAMTASHGSAEVARFLADIHAVSPNTAPPSWPSRSAVNGALAIGYHAETLVSRCPRR
eukprot:CAMPEP_0119410708 /NCGR_PEP_ID=MMETSP1335-20130426/3654_1 /TAXON_ID=259385 /ORGANISM="Chrysoculter rhomboideus, Strain RCC1486" /LENGTH=402 /DNA_ID=CAMNT_0007435277 /DNA_START=6 /DNA_END=1212 /DNA_ORIENTATION=+